MDVHNNGGHKALYRKLNYQRITGASNGCFVGMCIIGYLSVLSGSDLIIPSFAASCAIGTTTPENKCPPITLRGLAKALSGIVMPMAQLAANDGIIKSLPDNTDR